jgi:Protein of unknown function (DUF1592)/Protein of unknown function (DUF1588)/Protein of unknown function (DUF1585)/Protein of unknown function (DUF1595)
MNACIKTLGLIFLTSAALLLTACGGKANEATTTSATTDTGGSNAPPGPTASSPTPGASTPSPGASTPSPGASTPTSGNPPPQTALPPLEAGSAELAMRRLTRTQYVNTMQELVKQAMPTSGNTIAALVPAAANNYPVDSIVALTGQRHGGFQRLDQSIQQGHVDASYEVAAKMAAEMTQAARMGELMGACATDTDTSNDAVCLSNFVRKFGRNVFRRPLADAEVSFHTKLAGSTPVARESVADVITLLLSSPQMSYMVEHGQGTGAGRALLSAHELAARLSYHFLQAPPDKDLAALADNAKILDPATYRAQVERLAGDAKADDTLREFFAQWFRLQEMEALDSRVGTPLFDAFRGSYTPNNKTKQNAMDEITDMTAYLARNKGTLQDVMSDKRSYAKTPDIAQLYGTAVWDGSSAPAEFTDKTRSGLLSRIAFVATGSANSRPIIKGYRVRSALLCQPLPPPPAEAAMFNVDLSPTLTTRQVVEQVTEKPGTSCVGCHRQINPLGFASENFDSLGRSRSAQRMFDAQGKLLGELPIHTDATPYVTGADGRVAAGLLDLSQYILQSGEFERCFAQHYFRFTFGRGEREGDRDAITDTMNAARAGANLRELLTRYALRPEFQSKVF